MEVLTTMKRPLLSLTALLLAALLCTVGTAAANTPLSPQQLAEQKAAAEEQARQATLSALSGRWEAVLPVFYYDVENTFFSDPCVLEFDRTRGNPLLVSFASLDSEVFLPPADWTVGNRTLSFSFYDSPWTLRLDLTLAEDGNTLSGTLNQYERQTNVTLTRTSNAPTPLDQLKTEFTFEELTETQWREQLQQNKSYTPSAQPIPFTYSLYRWDKVLPMINVYGLGTVMDGRSDIEIMQSLLDIVSKNFRHNGSVLFPAQTDALSVIAWHNKNEGVECRGLSVILAEMLRTCGIEAKAIMCIPSSEPCEECHVVVHAWSRSLNQWVMLDPTYRLILRNRDGRPMSLPMLREALANEEPLYPNSTAGRNGQPFSMEYYRAYMTKNTFRFACATDFYAGGDRFADTDQQIDETVSAADVFGAGNVGNLTGSSQAVSDGGAEASSSEPAEQLKQLQESNPQHMLVPTEYKVPYRWSRSEIITTSAEDFWAAP